MVLAASLSRKGCTGATWRRANVRCDLTAEPPAHDRLVSDHDPFEIVACLDCTGADGGPEFGTAGESAARANSALGPFGSGLL